MTVNIGDLLRLSGRTRHGKNRIREHGSLVEVIHLRLDDVHSRKDNDCSPGANYIRDLIEV